MPTTVFRTTSTLAALTLCVSAAASARVALQSHDFCVTEATIDLSQQEICPEPDATFNVCLEATASEAYWADRVGGIGVVVWDVTGTAEVVSKDGESVSFNVAGSYTWGVRPGPDGFEWSVVGDDPGRFITGTSDGNGGFAMRISGGSGEIVEGQFSMNGDMSFEIADPGEFQNRGDKKEGVGIVASFPAVVEGKVVSDPGRDTDGDGVVDGVDNAMLVKNGGQEDKDKDGIGDVIDVCPADPADLCFGDGATE